MSMMHALPMMLVEDTSDSVSKNGRAAVFLAGRPTFACMAAPGPTRDGGFTPSAFATGARLLSTDSTR